MYLLGEAGKRLKVERERNQLSVEQAAVLTGVTPEQWRALEEGLICMHIDFTLGLKNLGFEPRFIGMGEREGFTYGVPFFVASQPEEVAGVAPDSSSPFDEQLLRRSSSYGPDSASFKKAIELMRRSITAVDAFLGEGSAAKSPDLVAALMSATIQCENRSGVMDIVDAIGNASESVTQSIENFTEAFAEVMDQAVEALTPPDPD